MAVCFLSCFLLLCVCRLSVTAEEESNCAMELLRTILRMEIKMAHLEKTVSSMKNVTESIKVTPKVAFNAYTTASGSYPANNLVIFPNVLLNEGGGYNKYTGTFTAPVSGLYHFTAHVCQPKNYHMVVSIVHGSKKLATATVIDADASSCGSVSAPAQVNKGETVLIKSSYSSSKLHAESVYRWPSFSGFLVNE